MSKFRELLKEKDIHGAQVARKLGIKRSAVNDWARGRCKPALKHIIPLADILGVSVEMIIACFN